MRYDRLSPVYIILYLVAFINIVIDGNIVIVLVILHLTFFRHIPFMFNYTCQSHELQVHANHSLPLTFMLYNQDFPPFTKSKPHLLAPHPWAWDRVVLL